MAVRAAWQNRRYACSPRPARATPASTRHLLRARRNRRHGRVLRKTAQPDLASDLFPRRRLYLSITRFSSPHVPESMKPPQRSCSFLPPRPEIRTCRSPPHLRPQRQSERRRRFGTPVFVQQNGLIRTMRNGAVWPSPFLDIRADAPAMASRPARLASRPASRQPALLRVTPT